ncbi:MAG: response regulator [Anaerolineales bacterium]|nr:response regulator [Anaerolineales bacterium]MCX7608621.1 response regulator [Anaerolineales bacterium]MDW8226549.1 response regulator [Anaerolineales bacterium]
MDINEQTFPPLFKDLVSRLYDRVAVESHPLAGYFSTISGSSLPLADVVRNLVREEIEQLKPEGAEFPLSPEWRPYLILKKRYMEGLDLHSIAAMLCIGDRQFRRDHSRALQALSTRIWQKYFKKRFVDHNERTPDFLEEQETLEFHAETLDLNDLLRGMEPLIRRRLELENVQLELKLCETQVPIFTDRVLLRQVILSLLNFILHIHDQPLLTLATESGTVSTLRIVFQTDEQWVLNQTEEQDSLDLIRQLCRRLPARLEETYPPPGKAGVGEVSLIFDGRSNRLVLIVDDQPAAQKMYKRYLSQTDLDVVGVTMPSQAVEVARETQPAAIILDVMMPHIDGWEILQTLQLDPQTKHIPVIVCSAWGEAELARALGAVAFLKKPVFQKELLAVFSRLGVAQEQV